MGAGIMKLTRKGTYTKVFALHDGELTDSSKYETECKLSKIGCTVLTHGS